MELKRALYNILDFTLVSTKHGRHGQVDTILAGSYQRMELYVDLSY